MNILSAHCLPRTNEKSRYSYPGNSKTDSTEIVCLDHNRPIGRLIVPKPRGVPQVESQQGPNPQGSQHRSQLPCAPAPFGLLNL